MERGGQAIVLIGFMGAGKSSVGRRLEKSTGLPRFDTDEMIAAKFDLSVPRIFEVHGEDVFRDAESEALQQLKSREPSIIVTGGGIVLRTTHRELLRQLGTVVYLQADEETLFERISRRASRPLLRTEDPRATMKELLERRLPLYEEIAELKIDTSRLSHDEVCELILQSVTATKHG
jgi:shikimate kinase